MTKKNRTAIWVLAAINLVGSQAAIIFQKYMKDLVEPSLWMLTVISIILFVAIAQMENPEKLSAAPKNAPSDTNQQ